MLLQLLLLLLLQIIYQCIHELMIWSITMVQVQILKIALLQTNLCRAHSSSENLDGKHCILAKAKTTANIPSNAMNVSNFQEYSSVASSYMEQKEKKYRANCAAYDFVAVAIGGRCSFFSPFMVRKPAMPKHVFVKCLYKTAERKASNTVRMCEREREREQNSWCFWSVVVQHVRDAHICCDHIFSFTC